MKAFFFDRDGTLNIDPGYINKPEDMDLFSEVPDTLKSIKSKGYYIFIISNQSGIGRGLINPSEYRKVSDRFTKLAGGYDIIDDILYCLHSPSHACLCRKPHTLLIDIIIDQYNIDVQESYFVGDKVTDIVCGNKAGLKTIFISRENNKNEIQTKFNDQEIMPDISINSISELLNIL